LFYFLKGLDNGKVYLYQCDYCPKTFRRLEKLDEHRRGHTGDLPFRCDMCDKCFAMVSF
jgi:hypothetical protein